MPIGSTPLHGNAGTRQSLYGTKQTPNNNGNLVVIQIFLMKGDRASLSYPYELAGAEDDPTTLFEMSIAEVYV